MEVENEKVISAISEDGRCMYFKEYLKNVSYERGVIK
jgi:hypothetical protein